ncbi:hypothetical protein KP78_21020 [Jeotgalibacillus soli]|uniref:Uncharacterized protein n=1 Tax=Jeotgalibacillus soli TaxID=889306 RepID=A0A0C2VP21_9BACL|nr:hypothetical protein KP78_21020 [Jeotgalibacillus soli]
MDKNEKLLKSIDKTLTEILRELKKGNRPTPQVESEKG